MTNKWNGEERRKNANDHDTLIELVQILKSHVDNFDKHVKDDRENFKDIGEKLWNHAKYIYMALGAIGIIQIVFGMHK